MRIRVFLFLFALGLAGLIGCGSSGGPAPKDGAGTPPPENSGNHGKTRPKPPGK